MDLNLRDTPEGDYEHNIQAELFDSLQAIEKADNKRKVTKWIKVLLIVTSLQYIAAIIYNSYYIDIWLTCDTCSVWSYYNLRALYSMIHTPVAGYLLFKGKRWGWILWFVYDVAMTFLCTLDLGSYAYYWRYFSKPHYLQSVITLGITVLTMVVYIIYLWKPVVATYFNISSRAKRNMLVIGICLGFVILIIASLRTYWAAL